MPACKYSVLKVLTVFGFTDCVYLHIFLCDKMIILQYRDNILAQYIHSFLASTSPDSIFIGDNAGIHTAHIVTQYFESETLHRIE